MEAEDGKGKFREDAWCRPGGGGGVSRVLQVLTCAVCTKAHACKTLKSWPLSLLTQQGVAACLQALGHALFARELAGVQAVFRQCMQVVLVWRLSPGRVGRRTGACGRRRAWACPWCMAPCRLRLTAQRGAPPPSSPQMEMGCADTGAHKASLLARLAQPPMISGDRVAPSLPGSAFARQQAF